MKTWHLSGIAAALVALSANIGSAQQINAGGVLGPQNGPIKLFLLYPNYRGYLFDDWPQYVKVDVSTASPSGNITVELLNSSGAAAVSQTVAAAADQTVELDASTLPDGTYQLTVAGQPAAYTIVKAPASARAAMKSYIDPDNVLYSSGKAVFPIGVYDMASPECPSSTSDWQSNLDLIRQAAITTYLPYTSSDCIISNFSVQTQALANHSMADVVALSSTYAGDGYFPYDLAASLGFAGNPATAQEATDVAGAVAQALAGNAAVLGYYSYDEPVDGQEGAIEAQYMAVKAGDGASVSWPLLNVATIAWDRCGRAPYYAPGGDPPQSDPCTDLSNWRDAGDVLATDPLATNGWNLDAQGNYWLPEVADWVNDLEYAVGGARPVWAVLPFYAGEPGFSGYPHWPSYQELHDMSYIAVVAGARGLWFWSWGNLNLPAPAGAPDPSAEIGYLDQVIAGLVPLEPAILSVDAALLAGNSAAGSVLTRGKEPGDGYRYLFAYNHAGTPLSATFTLTRPAGAVSVVGGENRTLALDPAATSFSDSFAIYQAHVYKISDAYPVAQKPTARRGKPHK
jgi:hypothetical protein